MKYEIKLEKCSLVLDIYPEGSVVEEARKTTVTTRDDDAISEVWCITKKQVMRTITHKTWWEDARGRIERTAYRGIISHGWISPSTTIVSEDPCETCTTGHCLTCHVARARAGLSYD